MVSQSSLVMQYHQCFVHYHSNMSMIKVNTSQDSGSLHLAYSKIRSTCLLQPILHAYYLVPPSCMYLSNLKTLSKSLNGSRKTTETSVKIISKNIRNRNRDCLKKQRNKGEISHLLSPNRDPRVAILSATV